MYNFLFLIDIFYIIIFIRKIELNSKKTFFVQFVV